MAVGRCGGVCLLLLKIGVFGWKNELNLFVPFSLAIPVDRFEIGLSQVFYSYATRAHLSKPLAHLGYTRGTPGGHTQDTAWRIPGAHTGEDQGQTRGRPGADLGQTWSRPGQTCGTPRAHIEQHLGRNREHLWHTRGTPGAHQGNSPEAHLGYTQAHPGQTWGTPRAHLGHTRGTPWEHPGNTRSTHGTQLGNSRGTALYVHAGK